MEARRRIGVRLVTACLLTGQARGRMEERHQLARELAGGALPAL